jgi:hypothetical protein
MIEDSSSILTIIVLKINELFINNCLYIRHWCLSNQNGDFSTSLTSLRVREASLKGEKKVLIREDLTLNARGVVCL